MARNICPECGERLRTPAKLEAHLAVHAALPSTGDYDSEMSGLPAAADAVLNAPSDSAPVSDDAPATPAAPASAPASASDPTIDPFDLPPMPEFETTDKPPDPAPEAVTQPDAVIEPAFSPGELASLLKMLFDTTAEMAGTGPRGRLSDSEANLVANLSVGWVNRQVAANFGNDPEGTKALIAVGIIAVNKAQVYYAAIQRKRVGAGEEPPSAPAPTEGEYSPRIPEEPQMKAPPVPAGVFYDSAMTEAAQ